MLVIELNMGGRNRNIYEDLWGFYETKLLGKA